MVLTEPKGLEDKISPQMENEIRLLDTSGLIDIYSKAGPGKLKEVLSDGRKYVVTGEIFNEVYRSRSVPRRMIPEFTEAVQTGLIEVDYAQPTNYEMQSFKAALKKGSPKKNERLSLADASVIKAALDFVKQGIEVKIITKDGDFSDAIKGGNYAGISCYSS